MIVLAKKLLSEQEIIHFQHSEDNSQQIEMSEIQKMAHSAAQASAHLLLEIINNRQVAYQDSNILEIN